MKILMLFLWALSFSTIGHTENDKGSLKEINERLTKARCIPNFENGKVAGYKCFQNGVEVPAESAPSEKQVTKEADKTPRENNSQGFQALVMKPESIQITVNKTTEPVSDRAAEEEKIPHAE